MMQDSVRDRIQRARDRIADPEHWCQGALAMGGNANLARIFDVPIPCMRARVPLVSVDPASPFAKKWCALGALQGVAKMVDPYCTFNSALSYLMDKASVLYPEAPGANSLAWVNDNLGHDAVLAVFDKLLADETVA